MISNATPWMYEHALYNGVATQSLRFDDGSSAYLTRTPSGAGNQKTWTWSAWVKLANRNASQSVFSANSGPSNISLDDGDSTFAIDGTYGGTRHLRNTLAKFRDISAWYHVVGVLDTTQGTEANRLRLYINGVEDVLDTAQVGSYPSQNSDGGINASVAHAIGRRENVTDSYFDGYMAEVNFVDGTALDASYFGETKNGVWIPKKYTGSYGTNGYRLEFKNTSVGTGSSSTIGADTSGNNNHWTSSGIVASDCAVPDSPENNFCTLNSVGRRYGHSNSGTFSEGNLKFASSGNASMAFGTMAINQIASQGGVYFEVRMDSLDVNRTYFGVMGDNGINNKSAESNGASYSFPIKGLMSRDPRGLFSTDTDGTSLDLTANTAFSNGDVAGIAILSDGKFFCHRNGTYLQNADGNVGNPSTGANPIATIDLTLGDWVAHVGYNSTLSVNFGQDGSFQGNETSGGNQDGNAIGDFMFAVPTNCFAICSSNMAEPTIGGISSTLPTDYFNTVLYSGTGSTQAINTGFSTDFTWIKSRGTANSHLLADSSRGSTKVLLSNDTNAEITDSNYTTFVSNGFSVSGNGTEINNSSGTYVSWNWKANGSTTSSNSDGSITSTVQASTDAGFSIVTYTGTGSATTFGHGLSSAPKWVVIKRRDGTPSWQVFHTTLGGGAGIELDTNGASGSSSSLWNSTAPTSSVVHIGTHGGTNTSSGTYVAYCFAEIEGYSKFGSYTGNGSTDGTFVYTGFRPAWILMKRTNSTGNWQLVDNRRVGYNPSNNLLFPDGSDAESEVTDNDILSNGFKLRTTGAGRNGSGSTYIYMAFAEAPFKYANAR